MRRTTLAYYNPSQRAKAEATARRYRKEGHKVVVERNKRWGTIDVLKVNRTKPTQKFGNARLRLGKPLFAL